MGIKCLHNKLFRTLIVMRKGIFHEKQTSELFKETVRIISSDKMAMPDFTTVPLNT